MSLAPSHLEQQLLHDIGEDSVATDARRERDARDALRLWMTNQGAFGGKELCKELGDAFQPGSCGNPSTGKSTLRETLIKHETFGKAFIDAEQYYTSTRKKKGLPPLPDDVRRAAYLRVAQARASTQVIHADLTQMYFRIDPRWAPEMNRCSDAARRIANETNYLLLHAEVVCLGFDKAFTTLAKADVQRKRSKEALARSTSMAQERHTTMNNLYPGYHYDIECTPIDEEDRQVMLCALNDEIEALGGASASPGEPGAYDERLLTLSGLVQRTQTTKSLDMLFSHADNPLPGPFDDMSASRERGRPYMLSWIFRYLFGDPETRGRPRATSSTTIPASASSTPVVEQQRHQQRQQYDEDEDEIEAKRQFFKLMGERDRVICRINARRDSNAPLISTIITSDGIFQSPGEVANMNDQKELEDLEEKLRPTIERPPHHFENWCREWNDAWFAAHPDARPGDEDNNMVVSAPQELESLTLPATPFASLTETAHGFDDHMDVDQYYNNEQHPKIDIKPDQCLIVDGHHFRAKYLYRPEYLATLPKDRSDTELISQDYCVPIVYVGREIDATIRAFLANPKPALDDKHQRFVSLVACLFGDLNTMQQRRYEIDMPFDQCYRAVNMANQIGEADHGAFFYFERMRHVLSSRTAQPERFTHMNMVVNDTDAVINGAMAVGVFERLDPEHPVTIINEFSKRLEDFGPGRVREGALPTLFHTRLCFLNDLRRLLGQAVTEASFAQCRQERRISMSASEDEDVDAKQRDRERAKIDSPADQLLAIMANSCSDITNKWNGAPEWIWVEVYLLGAFHFRELVVVNRNVPGVHFPLLHIDYAAMTHLTYAVYAYQLHTQFKFKKSERAALVAKVAGRTLFPQARSRQEMYELMLDKIAVGKHKKALPYLRDGTLPKLYAEIKTIRGQLASSFPSAYEMRCRFGNLNYFLAMASQFGQETLYLPEECYYGWCSRDPALPMNKQTIVFARDFVHPDVAARVSRVTLREALRYLMAQDTGQRISQVRADDATLLTFMQRKK